MNSFKYVLLIFFIVISGCSSIRDSMISVGLAKTSYNVDLEHELNNGNIIAIANIKIFIDGTDTTSRCGLVFGSLSDGVSINLLSDGVAYFPVNENRLKLKFILCKISSFDGIKLYLKDIKLDLPKKAKAFYFGDITIDVKRNERNDNLEYPYNQHRISVNVIQNEKTIKDFRKKIEIEVTNQILVLPEYGSGK